jgi:hypothetical protein
MHRLNQGIFGQIAQTLIVWLSLFSGRRVSQNGSFKTKILNDFLLKSLYLKGVR